MLPTKHCKINIVGGGSGLPYEGDCQITGDLAGDFTIQHDPDSNVYNSFLNTNSIWVSAVPGQKKQDFAVAPSSGGSYMPIGKAIYDPQTSCWVGDDVYEFSICITAKTNSF